MITTHAAATATPATGACRCCGRATLVPVIDFGAMPLANAFVAPGTAAFEDAAAEERHPLALLFCTSCALGQLAHTVAPEHLFADYPYLSSTSATMVAHARALTERLIAELKLGAHSRVIEIASNDGYLLQHYAARGVPTLGVEPASTVAALARAKGIETIEAFFDEALGERLALDGRVDVVHAHNVLAHVPEPHGFMKGLAALLRAGGIAVIEVPDAKAMLEQCLFDTIYHEHVFTFTLASLRALAATHGLVVVDTERVAIHGGSLRVTFAHASASAAASAAGAARVQAVLDDERAAGCHDVATWHAFAARVQRRCANARAWLAAQADAGRAVVGYGAAAKATVFLNVAHIDAHHLRAVVDKATTKHGKLMPGVRIPILPASALIDGLRTEAAAGSTVARPDAVLVLVWNIAAEVFEQQRDFRARGGRLYVCDDDVRELDGHAGVRAQGAQ